MKFVQQTVTQKTKQLKKIEAKEDGKPPVFRAAKESKEYYNVEILVNKTHVKISLVELSENREKLSMVTKLVKEKETLTKVVDGIPKSSYTILEPVRVNYDLVPEIKPKEPKVIHRRALATPFIEWYKDKLQELATLLDEYNYGYIAKNLVYNINSYEKKVIVDIVVKTGGVIQAGNHRFVFSYNNKEYLYFFNKKLESKTISLREIFA